MNSFLAAGVFSVAIESVRPQVFLLVSVLIGFGSMRFGSGRFRFSPESVRILLALDSYPTGSGP